jgi:hypothetical protein
MNEDRQGRLSEHNRKPELSLKLKNVQECFSHRPGPRAVTDVKIKGRNRRGGGY